MRDLVGAVANDLLEMGDGSGKEVHAQMATYGCENERNKEE